VWDVEAEEVAVVRVIEEEARWHHENLYNKAMTLYCVLASEKERAAMVKPIGWRPVLDTDVTMEEHVRILQAQVNETFLQQWPGLPGSLPSPLAASRLNWS
jgi:hypothetical protein